MAKARVFKSGNSQAVRLPKEFRFEVDEVDILRRGSEVVLRAPKGSLSRAFSAMASMPKDFMSGRRRDSKPQKRRGL